MDDFSRVGVFERLLRLLQVVQGDARIDVMCGVLHDVVQHNLDDPRELDMYDRANLAVEERPVGRVAIPSDSGMRVVLER